MTFVYWFITLGLSLAASASAADLALVTLADDGVRVLRGKTWYKIVPGARVEDGDVVEATGNAQLQLESGALGIVSVIGPAVLYALPARPAREAKAASPQPALDVARGWLKVGTRGSQSLRLRTPVAQLELVNSVGVLRADTGAAQVFVESGTVKLIEPGAGGKDLSQRQLRSNEYWARAGALPATTDERAPPAFVAAMPRTFKDALPALADKYKDSKVTLVPERDIVYLEARSWLVGPYRKEFNRRFQSKLADADFRSGVEKNIADHPEWDRMLHPEKYAPPPPPPLPAATSVDPPKAATPGSANKSTRKRPFPPL